MTFVIAKITDRDAGQVSMLADTKLTDKNDDTLNRRTLANPSQKVVIVDDDVVIGFAGDTPQSALRQVVALRGQSVGTIEKALRSYTADMHELPGVSKGFLIAVRKPSVQIIAIANGERQDRTEIGTGWIGDREAFETYSQIYQSPQLQHLPDVRPVNCDFQLKVNAGDRYAVLADAFKALPSWAAFTLAHDALGQEIRNELLAAKQLLARQAAAADAETGIEFGDPREGLNRARSVTTQTLETLSPEARKYAESFESVSEEVDRITTAVLTQLVAYGAPELLTGVSELTVIPSSPPTVSFKLLDAGYAGGIYWIDDPLIDDAVLLECFRFAGDNVFATRFHADATVLLGTGAAWRPM